MLLQGAGFLGNASYDLIRLQFALIPQLNWLTDMAAKPDQVLCYRSGHYASLLNYNEFINR